MKRIAKLQKDNLVYLLSFIIPVLIMLVLYISRGIYPFGDSAYLVRDMYHQYAPFFSEFTEKLKHGGSLAYSWNIGMGVNFTALYAYYLASPLNWILIFFPPHSMMEIMNILIVLKLGLCGWSFSYYTCKHFNHKDIRVAAFAIFYALSSYVAAYSWNIMWLDCLVLLPIIILGLERLVKKNNISFAKKPSKVHHCFLYCITLGLAILSNYYIGFMICIFSSLYFLYLLFIDETIAGAKQYLKNIGYFVLYSLLAGCLSAFLLIPEYYALKISGSGDLNFPNTLERYFSIFQMLSRSLMDVPVSIGLTHEPNIYSTVAVFLLIPLYWFSHSAGKREKIGKALLLFIFLLSFNLNIPDFIWHGFHFPNSLPSRQSFIFIFLTLIMSYEALRGIKTYTDKQLYGSFAFATALFLLFDHFMVCEQYSYGIVYVSLIFVALYLLVFALYRKRFTKALYNILPLLLLFILAITETIINTDQTGIETVTRSAYLNDNRDIDVLLAKTENNGFYRVEKFLRRTKNDAAWNKYKGVSIFSSTTNAPLNEYLKSMGFQSSMNAYSFSGYTPLTSSLLSVKYMLSDELVENTDLTALYAKSNNHYLYKNNDTLPLGFMVDKGFENLWDNNNSNGFLVQNSFVKSVISTTDLSAIYDAESKTDLFTQVDMNINGLVATIPVENTDDIYIYITTQDVNTIDISTTSPDGNITTKTYDDLRYKYMVNLGSSEPGSVITVTVKDDNITDLYASAYSFNNKIFESVYQELSKQPLTIETFNDTYLKGSINAAKDGLMYTSIPYDGGWSAIVDGKKTEIIPFKDALVALPLSEGKHTIELSYSPKGFKLGVVISIISLLVLAILAISQFKYRRENIKHEDTV
jgi:uncharacterized membrane protein YfhO